MMSTIPKSFTNSQVEIKKDGKKEGKKYIDGTLKPIHMFYIWYGELCRRANMTPLPNVKPAKPKNDTVLEFVCDRIKTEDWIPILSALRQDTSLHVIAIRSKVDCQFLEDVDTEKKAKEMKRKGGYLHTHFILTSLVSALCNLIEKSQVLTYLELDGIPIILEYIGPLLDALSKNKTIKVLSFKHCPLRDNGCQALCNTLRNIPNIEVLNLSACGLGSLSAQYVSKVIRYQQINRYCESWHCSLRYEDPDVELMTGLKRITLNNNPGIGDEGLAHILNELDDDLWIKAIDMQRCNITENISKRLIDVIDYSKSLEIADFRHNNLLSDKTIRKLLDVLKTKQQFGYENDYQWCLTATSLPYEHSVQDGISYQSSICGNIQKSKSAPFKEVANKASLVSLPIRRAKTCSTMAKSKSAVIKNVKNTKQDVIELNAKLRKEILKRMETERENKELHKKLESIQSNANTQKTESKNVKFDVGKVNLPRTKEALNIKIPLSEPIMEQDPLENQIKLIENKKKIINHMGKQEKKKDVEFVFTIEDRSKKNVAQSLFENLMYKTCGDSDSDGEKDIIDFFASDNNDRHVESDDSDTASNVSLLKFMESIKGTVTYDALDCGRQNKRNWENNKQTKVPPVH